LKLSEILKNMDYISFDGNVAVEITSIEYDSRKVKEGSIFVCIKGFKSDGHKYIRQAVCRLFIIPM
jgi:UDP-N-acetylmuramoyl-L-alanyl-D-glutamate--2,6-diaminopimelate ligase